MFFNYYISENYLCRCCVIWLFVLTNQTSLCQKRKSISIAELQACREEVAFSQYVAEVWTNMAKILKTIPRKLCSQQYLPPLPALARSPRNGHKMLKSAYWQKMGLKSYRYYFSRSRCCTANLENVIIFLNTFSSNLTNTYFPSRSFKTRGLQ